MNGNTQAQKPKVEQLLTNILGVLKGIEKSPTVANHDQLIESLKQLIARQGEITAATDKANFDRVIEAFGKFQKQHDTAARAESKKADVRTDKVVGTLTNIAGEAQKAHIDQMAQGQTIIKTLVQHDQNRAAESRTIVGLLTEMRDTLTGRTAAAAPATPTAPDAKVTATAGAPPQSAAILAGDQDKAPEQDAVTDDKLGRKIDRNYRAIWVVGAFAAAGLVCAGIAALKSSHSSEATNTEAQLPKHRFENGDKVFIIADNTKFTLNTRNPATGEVELCYGVLEKNKVYKVDNINLDQGQHAAITDGSHTDLRATIDQKDADKIENNSKIAPDTPLAMFPSKADAYKCQIVHPGMGR